MKNYAIINRNGIVARHELVTEKQIKVIADGIARDYGWTVAVIDINTDEVIYSADNR